MRITDAAKRGKSYMAATGSKIENYGEKKVYGQLDDGTGVSMKMQCADVKKTLGSVHRVNQNGNVIILDGTDSFMYNKITGKATKIEYENGQYFFNIWVKSAVKEKGENTVNVVKDKPGVTKGNRYAALAVDDETPGFARQGKGL